MSIVGITLAGGGRRSLDPVLVVAAHVHEPVHLQSLASRLASHGLPDADLGPTISTVDARPTWLKKVLGYSI